MHGVRRVADQRIARPRVDRRMAHAQREGRPRPGLEDSPEAAIRRLLHRQARNAASSASNSSARAGVVDQTIETAVGERQQRDRSLRQEPLPGRLA
jgi:hypothetical protein